MALIAPVLSEFHPRTTEEGGVDPLSLQRIYERLAERVLPALTVRMRRPRFLTAMAVGARICDAYDDDDVAADDVTPPWLVFEWFVLRAFVGAADQYEDRRGIPGIQKATKAVVNKRPLSAPAYLKTPGVFGFHGVYKTLARGLRVLNDDMRLEEGAYELLSVWEREQELPGFLGGSSGAGAEFRNTLQRLVERGMRAGETCRVPKSFRDQVAHALWPSSPGKKESKTLAVRLALTDGLEDRRDPDGVHMRAELCVNLEAGKSRVPREDEPTFLRGLRKSASAELKRRLGAVDDYESLCRPIVDAFDLLRYLGSTMSAVSTAEFAEHDAASSLADATATGARRILDNESLLDWEPDARAMAERYAEVRDGAGLIEAVLQHHADAQRRKPPDGKRPWIVRTRTDKAFVRTRYTLDEPPPIAGGYAHEYRVPTLSSFLADLGRVR